MIAPCIKITRLRSLGIVFQKFRHLLTVAVPMWYDTVLKCVPRCMSVNRFGELIGYMVHRRSVLAEISMHTGRYDTIMEGNWILGSWRSWRFSIFGQKEKERIFPTVSFIGKSPGQNSLEISHSLKIITNYNSYLLFVCWILVAIKMAREMRVGFGVLSSNRRHDDR